MSALRVFQLRSTVCVLCVAAFVFAIKNKSATLDEGRALVVYRYVWRDDTSDTFERVSASVIVCQCVSYALLSPIRYIKT